MVLSAIAAMVGIFSNEVKAYPDVVTTFGEIIKLYNKGLYARDSISMASQAVAQDMVTIIMGIPLLIVSLILVNKGNKKGMFLLSGTICYFLYTYTSYSFLMIYNHFYLIYLLLMIFSFYAFILCIYTLSRNKINEVFSERFSIKALSRFLWFIGAMLSFAWFGRIIPTLFNDLAPEGLEHYSTLAIQTLDLGFVIPACFVFGILLRKKNEWGYWLSVVLLIKGMTMTAAVSAMTILMRINGVQLSILETFMMPTLFIGCVYFMIKTLSQIKA